MISRVETEPPLPVVWRKNPSDGRQEEHRTEVQAEVECTVCGAVVELVAETDGHYLDDDGRWRHDSYGPATAVCCGRLYADWWEGTFAYDLAALGEPGAFILASCALDPREAHQAHVDRERARRNGRGRSRAAARRRAAHLDRCAWCAP